jgi:hypothetical protein
MSKTVDVSEEKAVDIIDQLDSDTFFLTNHYDLDCVFMSGGKYYSGWYSYYKQAVSKEGMEQLTKKQFISRLKGVIKHAEATKSEANSIIAWLKHERIAWLKHEQKATIDVLRLKK